MSSVEDKRAKDQAKKEQELQDKADDKACKSKSGKVKDNSKMADEDMPKADDQEKKQEAIAAAKLAKEKAGLNPNDLDALEAEAAAAAAAFKPPA